MKNFNVTINCQAVYNGVVKVPDDATYEEALEIAKRELPNIPLGELEYVQGSDVLDEDNCDFEENFENEDEYNENEEYISFTDEQKNVLQKWDIFDAIMKEANYSIIITDEDVREEEIAQTGRVLSTLGSIALQDDVWKVYFKAFVGNDYEKIVVCVYDRNGNHIIEGRELERINIPNDMTDEQFEEYLKALISKYEKYGKDNRVPTDIV